MATARENLKKFLQENINFEDYDNKENTFQNVLEQFEEEYLHGSNIKQYNKTPSKIISDWLRGLPSCLDLPFTYFDINNLMHALGYEVRGWYSHDIDGLYWSELGEIIYEESIAEA